MQSLPAVIALMEQYGVQLSPEEASDASFRPTNGSWVR